jgi:hypothetical protein
MTHSETELWDFAGHMTPRQAIPSGVIICPAKKDGQQLTVNSFTDDH